jgi:hypothetical protein
MASVLAPMGKKAASRQPVWLCLLVNQPLEKRAKDDLLTQALGGWDKVEPYFPASKHWGPTAAGFAGYKLARMFGLPWWAAGLAGLAGGSLVSYTHPELAEAAKAFRKSWTGRHSSWW